MAEANKEIFSGGMYEFLIGEELVPFAMHKALVSRYSDRLHDMMSSGTPDTISLVREVDTETFARFVEWAYTGTYTAAAPENVNWATSPALTDGGPSIEAVEPPAEESPAEEPSAEPAPSIEAVQFPYDGASVEAVQGPDDDRDDFWGWPLSKKQKKAKKARQSLAAWAHEDDVKSPEAEVNIAIYEAPEDPIVVLDEPIVILDEPLGPFLIEDNATLPNNSAMSNSAHFLSHAKLWSFANKNGFTKLCDLTTRRLSSSLQDVRHHQERVQDLVDLARYVYVYPGSGGLTIRRAIASYTSAHFGELVQTEKFERLLRGGGHFVIDTCHLLGQRLRKERSELDPYWER